MTQPLNRYGWPLVAGRSNWANRFETSAPQAAFSLRFLRDHRKDTLATTKWQQAAAIADEYRILQTNLRPLALLHEIIEILDDLHDIDLIDLVDGRYVADKFCVHCGCTTTNSCMRRCHWVIDHNNPNADVCSNCVGGKSRREIIPFLKEESA